GSRAPCRPARVHAAGGAHERPYRRPGAGAGGCGQRPRHPRPPRAHVAALARAAAPGVRRHPADDAAHLAHRTPAGRADGGPHHRRERSGRPRVAAPPASRGPAPRRAEWYRARARRRAGAAPRPRGRSRGARRPGRAAGGRDRLAAQGSARRAPGALVRAGATGLLISPLDPAAWAAALEQMLGDGEASRRLGQAGRTLVRREFTLERTVERTELVYREALARRPARRLLGAATPR